MSNLRNDLIKLAFHNPELRSDLLPLLRPRIASSNIKKLLAPLFEPFLPFVTNSKGFVTRIKRLLPHWLEDPDFEMVDSDIWKTQSTEICEEEDSGSWEDPPDEHCYDYEYPELVHLRIKTSIPHKQFAKDLISDTKSMIKDLRGFQSALKDLFSDKKRMKILAHLYRSYVLSSLRVDTEELVAYTLDVWEEIIDEGSDCRWSSYPDIESVDSKFYRYKISGSEITVLFDLYVSVGEGDPDHPEHDYDGPDYDYDPPSGWEP